MSSVRGQLILRILHSATAELPRTGMTLKDLSVMSYPSEAAWEKSRSSAVAYRAANPGKYKWREMLDKASWNKPIQVRSWGTKRTDPPVPRGTVAAFQQVEKPRVPVPTLLVPNPLRTSTESALLNLQNLLGKRFGEAMGHEAVHGMDRLGPSADPGTAVKDNLSRELEPSLQQLKTRLISDQVDPYSPEAADAARQMLLTDPPGHLAYLKGNAKEVERMLPFFVHVMRGVANTGNTEQISRTAASEPSAWQSMKDAAQLKVMQAKAAREMSKVPGLTKWAWDNKDLAGLVQQQVIPNIPSAVGVLGGVALPVAKTAVPFRELMTRLMTSLQIKGK